MSFLTTTKLIGKPLKPTDYRQYWAELFLLLLIGIAWMGYDDLSPIRNGAPIASIPRHAFALIGALGIYGIRLSSLVAMARRNRMPQTAEWCVFLLVTALMLVLFVLSGTLVKAYATAHNYHFCYQQNARASLAVFAHANTACPNLPDHARPY